MGAARTDDIVSWRGKHGHVGDQQLQHTLVRAEEAEGGARVFPIAGERERKAAPVQAHRHLKKCEVRWDKRHRHCHRHHNYNGDGGNQNATQKGGKK